MIASANMSGDVIGYYNLMEQIGEGGFGVVFVAEQQKSVKRGIALKVIKPGMDARDVIARLDADRCRRQCSVSGSSDHMITSGRGP
jgi:serine/threonine protein kinase